MTNNKPTLSIVVTIVDGGSYLRDFLVAATSFENPPSLELIVPYDASIPDTKSLSEEFPDVRFLDMGVIETVRPIKTEGGQHELYDRRRAHGLAAAEGEIIAMLEDRGHPSPNWASTLVRLHRETGKSVIGGAIECKKPVSLLNWAFYVTDFGRYGLPFESGKAGWVSDVNVSYSREALEKTRHLWKERFHEMLVHRYLESKGEDLFLSNELVVHHMRPPISLGALLRERFDWGILFGYVRVMQLTKFQRLVFIVASPLIPLVLWVRHGVIQVSKGRGLRYLAALPYVLMLTTAWTLGEVWGYITQRP